jgi:hypothetical protein
LTIYERRPDEGRREDVMAGDERKKKKRKKKKGITISTGITPGIL